LGAERGWLVTVRRSLWPSRPRSASAS